MEPCSSPWPNNYSEIKKYKTLLHRKGKWMVRYDRQSEGIAIVTWMFMENINLQYNFFSTFGQNTTDFYDEPILLTVLRICLADFTLKAGYFALHLTEKLFSSPEPKAQVSYCHSAPSVVRPPSSSSSSVNFHIFDFFSRTAWWILMKLGMHEVLMVPYKCCCFSARSAQGWIQGGAKTGHGGSPSSRNFFFRPEGYSDKPNA